MTTHAVTLQLPEHVYLRLQLIAQATQQSFDDVVLCHPGRCSPVGKMHRLNFRQTSPRSIAWTTTPCGTLHDERQTASRWCGIRNSLEKNANVTLSDAERAELTQLHCCRSLHAPESAGRCFAALARPSHSSRRHIIKPQ